ncbi:hypothetical protein [Microlunatus ginsengisoli]|jgi:ribosomal protein L37AE/L43A|uniref:Insertion element protein n=1 Tax=Microlunatus ginsengisoli TaxID=363863 RepID=A0ABP7AE28_9ACTN
MSVPGAGPGAPTDVGVSSHTATRQQILYCPYCAEETLFPLEHGWECRSCGRAFSITFLGLRPNPGRTEET